MSGDSLGRADVRSPLLPRIAGGGICSLGSSETLQRGRRATGHPDFRALGERDQWTSVLRLPFRNPTPSNCSSSQAKFDQMRAGDNLVGVPGEIYLGHDALTRRMSSSRDGEARFAKSIVTVPKRSNPDAGVRASALATPFAARTTLSEPIVAMPAAPPGFARAMVAVNQDNTGAQAIRDFADGHRGGACDRGCGCQQGRRSQLFQRSYHFHSQSFNGRRQAVARPSVVPSTVHLR